MKTPVAREPVPYRSETVFRSAERLVASKPKKTAWKPWSRAAVFAAGLVCGLGLALWFSPRLREAVLTAVAPESAGAEGWGGRYRGRDYRLSKVKPSDTPAAAPKTAQRAETTDDRAIAGSPSELAPAARAPLSIDATASIRARPATAYAPPIIVTAATTNLTLVAEMRSLTGKPKTVTFNLSLRPELRTTDVKGTAWFANDPERPQPFQIAGTLSYHTITLNELVVLPRAAGWSPYGFIIDLPEASTSQELEGLWSHGAAPGGTLVFKTALSQ